VLNEQDEGKRASALSELEKMLANQDMAFINEDITDLLSDSRDGLSRVAEIVKGLKLFSRVDSDHMQQHNINDCVRTTLAMVNNQLKYINAGQAIESTGKNGKVTITTCTAGKFVELRVEDTGCGIPSSHLDKLFNPFFTTKPEGQGTGLGLSISFGIAQEHGGTLSATSKEGEGSIFTLALPLVSHADKTLESEG
jgi:C4-dicarboxylate-specific signal transduction histidine kinase